MTERPRQPWPTEADIDDAAHYGGAPVYDYCRGSDRPVSEDARGRSGSFRRLTCSVCYTPFPAAECRGDEGERTPPEHDRLLRADEQATIQLNEIAGDLGFDPWNDRPVLHAVLEAARPSESTGTPSVAARVAAGTAALAIIKAQQAPPDILAAVRKLDGWAPEVVPQHVRDDNTHLNDATPIPLLTEAFLYPLLGKDAARTLLALWRAVKESTGA